MFSNKTDFQSVPHVEQRLETLQPTEEKDDGDTSISQHSSEGSDTAAPKVSQCLVSL